MIRNLGREGDLCQPGCWYRPRTFPPGSRKRAVISGASAPIGCTISPPLATIKSTVAATLSTITYNKRPGCQSWVGVGEPSCRLPRRLCRQSFYGHRRAAGCSSRIHVCKTPPSARYRFGHLDVADLPFARVGGIGSSFKGVRNRGFASFSREGPVYPPFGPRVASTTC